MDLNGEVFRALCPGLFRQPLSDEDERTVLEMLMILADCADHVDARFVGKGPVDEWWNAFVAQVSVELRKDVQP
jgi:hypothetical protein